MKKQIKSRFFLFGAVGILSVAMVIISCQKEVPTKDATSRLNQSGSVSAPKTIGKTVLSHETISTSDARFQSLLNSSFYTSYNTAVFPALNLSSSSLITFTDQSKAIFVPFGGQNGGLIGYLDLNNSQSIVGGVVTKVSAMAALNTVTKVTYYEATGEKGVEVTLNGTIIQDINIDEPAAQKPCSFTACFLETRQACSESVACAIASDLLGPYFTAGVVACCSIYAGGGCQGDKCSQ